MPLIDPTSLIVRGALQDVSFQYRNGMYVANDVFPLVDGIGRKTKVAKYQKGPWFRDEADVRAPGSPARVGHFSLTTQNLDPINYAFATEVTDEEREEAAKPGNLPIQPDMDAVEFIAEKLDLKREIRTSAIIQATVWSGVSAGGTDAEGAWGHATAASDTTLVDIALAKDTIRANTGILPNTILLDWVAWSKLSIAPALQALMFPTTLPGAAITTATFGGLVGLNVIVGSAVKNSDEETTPTDSFTSVNIWGPSATPTKGSAFIFYKPPVVGLKTASAGYQYRLRQSNGSSRLTTTWRDSARHADMYDSQEEVDIAAVGLDLGYLFKDTAAT